MGSDKLFKEYERARASAEAAAKKYAEFLKGSSKGKEPDDQRTIGKQNTPVRREVGKGK